VDLRDSKTSSTSSIDSPKNSPYTKYLSALFADRTGRTLATSSDIVTFLDTPGHSIFTKMRLSGAAVADLILLIIAGNEGIQSQTLEAMQIALDAKTPIIVVINKIDIASPEQIELVYKQLQKHKLSRPDLTRQSNPLLADPPNFKCGHLNPCLATLSHQLLRAMFDDMDDQHPVVGICEISAKFGTNVSVLKTAIAETSFALEDSRSPELTITPTIPKSTIASLKQQKFVKYCYALAIAPHIAHLDRIG